MEGTFLRQILRPHLPRLLKLWRYAVLTKIPLRSEDEFGWSSGHRPNHKEPESWATASVYAFSQCLRRLTGIWARESAAETLKVSTIHIPQAGAIQRLLERGDTWAAAGRSAASQLMCLFVNPVRFFGCGNALEPDSQPLNDNQARAAFLFGPPGTSKTTLCRSVADAIGWDYVELHASHFVADGLPNVQRTADMIFERLLQLDRTVILFDEVDELVRARDKEHDAFGRFLTTSMLPKLAELWNRRSVIYFVATNHISFFDSAVIRAQRFDALIQVGPPSLRRKVNRLKQLLRGTFQRVNFTGLNALRVQNAVRKVASGRVPRVAESDESKDKPLPQDCGLAKFLLIRWDQLQELATAIRARHIGQKALTVNRAALEAALGDLADQSLRKCQTYQDYSESAKYEQHDFSKVSIWKVAGTIPSKYKGHFTKTAGSFWYQSELDLGDFRSFPGRLRMKGPGVLRYLNASRGH